MKKALKIVLWTILGILLVPIIVLSGMYLSADMGEPTITINPSDYVVDSRNDTAFCDNSFLTYDSCGLWELYVEGSNQVRGARQGALTKDLMKYQEDVFINQIREIIPSDKYLSFLRRFIIIFNRNLGKCMPLEYRNEIIAMSEFCTHDYDAIGTPYQRQLNYHAAHDIGHAMQQYMLVGCSSFVVCDDKTKDGSMIVGRNFDFYVGDDFAKNKLVTFAAPDSGYRYASVCWAGMLGVLSGINECGLTVTINAAKGAIPTSAATPISIVTREILQYASNIEEAYKIAQSRKTFVSESILIGSASDGRAAIIEKTPEEIALYDPHNDEVLCTNHYQSDKFKNDSYNLENMAKSDSKYRYERLQELIQQHPKMNYKDAVSILRNRFGKNNKDIGIGNEMTLNQSIGHHSVVFKPQDSLMWVTTQPWQSGKIVCYDLRDFFAHKGYPQRKYDLDVDADSLFLKNDYPRLIEFRKDIKEIKNSIKENKSLDDGYMTHFIKMNPNHYYTYRLLGDYYASRSEKEQSVEMYNRALKCVIPYQSERTEIEDLIKQYNQ